MSVPSVASSYFRRSWRAIIVALAVSFGLAAVAWFVYEQVRSRRLRNHFGPEYDRVLQREGDARKAEGVLEFREKRREKFKIRPLSPSDRSSFTVRWNEVQARLVGDTQTRVLVSEEVAFSLHE